MIYKIKLKIPIEEDNNDNYLKYISNKLGCKICQITKPIKILSKKLIINKNDSLFYEILLAAELKAKFCNNEAYKYEYTTENIQNPHSEKESTNNRHINELKPIIIGFGPAGMFAALKFIEAGIKPIIFERGKRVEQRIKDVNNFIENKKLNEESNIQFGEGGAGTFSDGKLFSRMHNNSIYVKEVLQTFVKFGANSDILYIEKPHLGTDILRKIVVNIRNFLLANGAEIHFNAKLTDIFIKNNKLISIEINRKKEFYANPLILAAGHSADDLYNLLYGKQVSMSLKPVSVGIRIEHPAKLINLIRYGKKYYKTRLLPAATYSFNYTDKNKKTGAYTFCMCPGGEIVNAASIQGHLVVNGMSYSQRDKYFSNAAIIVPCMPKHFTNHNNTKYNAALSGLHFLRKIEQKAYLSTNKPWQAPAQNLLDFLSNKKSEQLNKSSYKMGLYSVNLYELLPDFVTDTLKDAFLYWQKDYPLFVSDKALLVGVETRSTSAVKIIRDENGKSENINNMYIVGECSGYTGGIVSAATDAIKCVNKFFKTI